MTTDNYFQSLSEGDTVKTTSRLIGGRTSPVETSVVSKIINGKYLLVEGRVYNRNTGLETMNTCAFKREIVIPTEDERRKCEDYLEADKSKSSCMILQNHVPKNPHVVFFEAEGQISYIRNY